MNYYNCEAGSNHIALRRKSRPPASNYIACRTIGAPSKKSQSGTKKGGAKVALQNQAAADKYWKMRRINNKASRKNREKMRALLRSKEEEEADLEKKRGVLQAKHDELKKQIVELKTQFKMILRNCPRCIILKWGAQMNRSNKC